MKHVFELLVTTDTVLRNDRVAELVHKTLQVGQADAADTADDEDSCDLTRAESAIVRDFDFSLLPVPAPTTQLGAQARLLVSALDELGFNDPTAPTNGADTVDVIARYLPLLNQLPALMGVVEAALRLAHAKGRFHTEQNYKALASALDKLKGA